ncbi:MAG: polyamine aminopropyltransferase [bacterium]
MELWYTEKHTENTGITIKVVDCLFGGRTKYQDIAVLHSPEYGRILLLDGLVMLTERDEFVYHEMIAHVPLLSHPDPRKVLVIGGGDGGTVREILKHPGIEHIDLVEIDEVVIEKCREFFPTVSKGLDSPKVTVHVTDGIEYVRNAPSDYDLVIIDSSDPIGPGEGLFVESFYQCVFNILREDGLMVAQSESPFLHGEIISAMYRSLDKVFPVSRMYLAFIPTYPAGCWSFAWCSKNGRTPLEYLDVNRYQELQPKPRYYTPEVHRSSFSLPHFIREIVPHGSSL